MNRSAYLSSFLATLVIACLTTPPANGTVYTLGTLEVTCMINGEVKRNIKIYLHPDAQGNTEDADWGDGFKYTGVNGRPNCNCVKYDYFVFDNISMSWSLEKDGNTYNATNNKAYWDWVYYGYSGNPDCDYDTNCHGFAFPDEGDWPYGAYTIVHDAGNPPCWVEMPVVPFNQALESCTIGVQAEAYGHTIKFTPKECTIGSATEPIWIVDDTEEQFKESGTYTLTTACTDPLPYEGSPPGVDYPHAREDSVRDNMVFNWYSQGIPTCGQ